MLTAWLGGLLGALAVMSRVGADHPGSPPLTEPAQWSEWWWSRDPIDAAAGIARLVALASIVYLLVVTAAMLAAAVVARRSGQWRTRRRARALLRGLGLLAPRFVLGITASAVLAVPTVAGATTPVRSPGPSAPNTPGATMERLTGEQSPSGTTDGSATSGKIEPADPWLPWAAPMDGGPRLEPATLALTEPFAAPIAPTTREVVVRAGDHLWGIAASEMSARLGRAATDSEIGSYWRALIGANRDRLADRDNPDLILPGQTLVLP